MDNGGFVVGGWVLVRPVPVPSYLTGLELAELLTISDCIQDDLPRPEPWFGDWFHDLDEAREAARSTEGPEPAVVAVVMSREMAQAFMADSWGEEAPPWFEVLREGRPLPDDAEVLGFEVVGAEPCLDFHSWHCHDYADDARRDLGVGVDDRGLLRTHEDACSVLAWMLRRPPQEAPAPVPWTVVGLATT